MQLKTSLLNKALFRNFSSVILFLTIINLICTFLLVPFSYIMVYIDGSTIHHYSKYFVGVPEMLRLYFFGAMLYSVLCGVFITYFLKNQDASDFVHSLPVKRSTILTTIYVTFLSHGLVNLLLNGFITFLFGFKFANISFEKLCFWIVFSLAVYFICFTFTMMMSLFINNLLTHLILTIVVAMSPFIIGTLVYTTHMMNFVGLNHFPQKWVTYLTVPAKLIEELSTEQFNCVYWFIVIVVSGIITVFNFYIYKKRKNERINEAYSNYIVQFIFYLVTMLIATLLGGIIFRGLIIDNKWLMIIVYIVAFNIVYVLLEMLAQKSVRITFYKQMYAITFVFVTIGILVTFFIGQMRENYIPKTEEISSVKANIHQTTSDDKENILNTTAMDDTKYIDNMTKVHQYLINHHRENGDNHYNITYRLKDGRTVKRQYFIMSKDENKIKKMAYQGVNKDKIMSSIKWDELSKLDISIAENSGSEPEEKKLNTMQVKALLPILKKELNSEMSGNKYEDYANGRYFINFTENERTVIYSSSYSYGIAMNLYNQELLKAYNKIGIKDSPSDFLPKGDVYLIGKKKDFDAAVNSDNMLETFNVKKQDRKAFEAKFNQYGANTDGNYLYFIKSDSGTTLLLMTN
ncbi:hypothetical protein [Macrococcus sp. DPC7161]|uniref:hypothetical protein n=1 Tax=Macrococcus sp. DPC7161 TaxID=2507060 RepID=UPI00100A26CF|nr:hypothetical protein [Macrococcus sp. DPC7161]RXK17944.1 hypothetical protein ER639_07110 [Macrococcus sp. DPC7161]